MKVGDLVKHKYYSDLTVGIITRRPNYMSVEVFWGVPFHTGKGRATMARLESDGDLEIVSETR